MEQLSREHAFISREVFRRLALHAVLRRSAIRPGRIETIDDVTSS